MGDVGFKKPFRARPVVLGSYARAQQGKARRQQRLGKAFSVGWIGALVVGFGWLASRASNLPNLPVYYPNCAAARSAGAAPIKQGEPGYRASLDADSDGIACEPYPGM